MLVNASIITIRHILMIYILKNETKQLFLCDFIKQTQNHETYII